MFVERLLNIVKVFKNLDDLKYIHKNVLDKVCFTYDVAYSGSKWHRELLQVMKDMAYEIAINPKYDGYQRRLASMVYKFFTRKEDWER